MAEIIVMPKLGLLMEKGTLSAWKVKEGDPVRIGDVIAEITTEKITYELESETDGVLLRIILEEDEEVPVGDPIAVIGHPGEDISTLRPSRGAVKEAEDSSSEPVMKPDVGGTTRISKGRVVASPAAKKLAAELNLDLSKITGTGPKGRVTLTDVRTNLLAEAPDDRISASDGTESAGTEGKATVFVTPTARRIAADLGIDLEGITGSGLHNRILAKDVAAAADQNTGVGAYAETGSVPGTHPNAEEEDIRGGVVKEIPYTGMRRLIGEHMQSSRHLSPTVTYNALVDAHNLKEMLAQVNAAHPAHDKISITAVIIKAVALTLRRMPLFNATLQTGVIKMWRNVNIGLAFALDEGLIVPVIREADRKEIDVIVSVIRDLTDRARQNRLLPDEIRGSTFTVSNLGSYDSVDFFDPIINQPEAAVLGIGRMKDTVVAVKGKPTIHATMGISLTCDHRMIDGAPASKFLRVLMDYLEAPFSMLL